MIRIASHYAAIVGVALLLSGTSLAEAPSLRWVRDLDEAKKLAADEHKDLLVNFTGLEWCQGCRILHERILARDEFAAAAKDFVLVDLDYPADLDELGPLKKSYVDWARGYMINTYPTVVLADRSGRPYAYLSGAGCAEETTVTGFLESLAMLHEGRIVRDAEFAAAEKSTGSERAGRLNDALNVVACQLESVSAHKDDALVIFYKPEIDEICRLDAANRLGLRAAYEARLKARDTFVGLLVVLDECNEKQDFAGGIERIDRVLSDVKDESVRIQLEQRRCAFLEELGRNEEAMVLLRRLVADPSCPADDRDWMLRNIAVCLVRMERIDEAAAFYDDQIVAAADRATRRYFQRSKAELMMSAGTNAQAIALCRELLCTAKPDTEEWATDEGRLGKSLQQAGQQSEAIAALREQVGFWRKREDVGALLYLARTYHGLGLDAVARETIDDAATLLNSSPIEPAKKKKIDRMHADLDEVRALIAAADDKSPTGAK